MQQQWTHPEYQIRLDGGLAYSLAGGAALPREVRFENLGLTGFLLSAVAAVLIAVPVLVYRSNLVASTTVSRGAPSEQVFRLGADNKALFLSLVSARERREIASQVHYVGEIIKSAGHSPNEWRELAAAIVLESKRANIDPLFVAALVKSESTFNRHARSNRGALGLMQVLPGTGQYISKLSAIGWLGESKLRDTEYNLRLGIAYIKYLRRYFGDNVEHALIAYNWGPGNLIRAIKHSVKIPTPPVKYAKKIIATYGKWKNDFHVRKGQYQYIQVGDLAVG